MLVGGRMSISSIYANYVMNTINPKKITRAQLANEGRLQGMSGILIGMGRQVHGLDEIRVWGKMKEGPEKMPDFRNARMDGSLGGADQATKDVMELTGIEPKPGGKLGYTERMAVACETHWKYRADSKPIGELSEKDLDSLNYTGTLGIGYGDPTVANNGYGAGPTRDPRRLYFITRLVMVIPEVEIMRVWAYGKTFSKAIPELVKNLEASYSVVYPGHGSWMRVEKAGETADISIFPINLSTEKALVGARIVGDLEITISASARKSGQDFLSDDVKHTSPLFGGLGYFLGDNVAGAVPLAIKGYIDGRIDEFREIAKKMLPSGTKAIDAGVVLLENS